MTQRFFVSPGSIFGDEITFDSAMTHQLRNVLRMRPGARVIVLDDTGIEYEVTLTSLDRAAALGRIEAQHRSPAEPRLSLTLYQSLIKGDRFEWVLQKGTELGVSRFVPLSCQRTVVRDPERIEKRRTRWERILREAAEQSHRGRLPQLSPVTPFAEACSESVQAHEVALLPWEAASDVGLCAALRALPTEVGSVALLIGPEGGFASDEVALAQERGIRIVTLGPRILRAETAGIAAATIVLSERGEMG